MEITGSLFARVNKAKHLFLRSLTESGINQLHLVVEEAVVNEAKRGKMKSSDIPDFLAFLLESSAPIESIDGCLAFRLYWKHYAAYLVTEECVGSCGDYADEVFEGDRLRKYSKSHFLRTSRSGHRRTLSTADSFQNHLRKPPCRCRRRGSARNRDRSIF